MKNKQTLISVVMPVYNAGLYLVESLESLLNQTYKNVEIIIIDDASTDSSRTILTNYKKKYANIRILTNKKNLGIAASTERGISYARGSYIARMDADDISLPNRLTKQLAYLKSHPEVVAVGTQCLLISKEGSVIGDKTFPTSAADVYRYIYHFIPVQHPTLMIARQRLPKNFTFYNGSHTTAEDVELLFKLFTYGKVENLPDYLFAYRLHGKNNSLKQVKKTFYLTLSTRLRAIRDYGYRPTFRGVLTTALQTVIVSLFPETLLTSFYLLAKGIKTVTITDLRKSFSGMYKFSITPLLFLITYFK